MAAHLKKVRKKALLEKKQLREHVATNWEQVSYLTGNLLNESLRSKDRQKFTILQIKTTNC